MPVLPVALLLLAGCAASMPRAAVPLPPPMLLGDFVDDYGIGHHIDAHAWLQRPATRYEIVAWHPEGQYLVARNAAGNRSDAGRWTRIDWVALPHMPPYAWAFCLSAWDAATQADAERADIAHRDTPKTGCNGYPFSRMKRVALPAD
jgi:hypothetical protein